MYARKLLFVFALALCLIATAAAAVDHFYWTKGKRTAAGVDPSPTIAVSILGVGAVNYDYTFADLSGLKGFVDMLAKGAAQPSFNTGYVGRWVGDAEVDRTFQLADGRTIRIQPAGPAAGVTTQRVAVTFTGPAVVPAVTSMPSVSGVQVTQLPDAGTHKLTAQPLPSLDDAELVLFSLPVVFAPLPAGDVLYRFIDNGVSPLNEYLVKFVHATSANSRISMCPCERSTLERLKGGLMTLLSTVVLSAAIFLVSTRVFIHLDAEGYDYGLRTAYFFEVVPAARFLFPPSGLEQEAPGYASDAPGSDLGEDENENYVPSRPTARSAGEGKVPASEKEPKGTPSDATTTLSLLVLLVPFLLF